MNWYKKSQNNDEIMKCNETIYHSKFLSFVLRHEPDKAGITLDREGWADVRQLLEGCRKANHAMNLDGLKEVVETNDKKRFEFNADGTKIRASQGHSVKVDLGYEPKTPPDVLYHGTVTVFLNSILSRGLDKQGRQHVHLSADKETAQNVGSRREKDGVSVEILEINAKQMHADGFKFYQSTNGVWLVDAVPPKYFITSDRKI